MLRRELLAGGLALAAAPGAMAGAPGALSTADDLQARTARLKADPRVEVRVVGRSARGRPIELISLGKGERNALVVGCPHPNEPVGCLTIEALIEQLRREPATGAGFRWHFIKAIDPDGLDLNRSWLEGPLTPERYFAGFYRPAFDRQPEYGFPLHAGVYDFDRATPENLAWRAVLELTRPQLQASLHNADYGGAFYILSQAKPGLAEALSRQPAEAGLTLNPMGEPFADMAPYMPGVLAFPDIAAAAKAGAWKAGNSSAGYAAERYGTFSLVNEVPFWDDPRLRDQTPSGRTIGDVARTVVGWNVEITAVLSASLPRLTASGPDAGGLMAVLQEGLATARRQNAMLEKLAGSPALAKPLAVKDWALQVTILRLAALRPYAMLRRLAATQTTPAAATAQAIAAAHLRQGLAELHAEAKLSAVPIRTLTELQMRAVLTTARALA
jgi:hypothetical protein